LCDLYGRCPGSGECSTSATGLNDSSTSKSVIGFDAPKQGLEVKLARRCQGCVVLSFSAPECVSQAIPDARTGSALSLCITNRKDNYNMDAIQRIREAVVAPAGCKAFPKSGILFIVCRGKPCAPSPRFFLLQFGFETRFEYALA
jgi:hypothetical protein